MYSVRFHIFDTRCSRLHTYQNVTESTNEGSYDLTYGRAAADGCVMQGSVPIVVRFIDVQDVFLQDAADDRFVSVQGGIAEGGAA